MIIQKSKTIFDKSTSNGVWYTYVLKSKKASWYIGSTRDLRKRILRHNSGKNRSTKHGIPFKEFVYS